MVTQTCGCARARAAKARVVRAISKMRSEAVMRGTLSRSAANWWRVTVLRHLRHPEVRAKRASKDEPPGPSPFEGRLRGHLRVTVTKPLPRRRRRAGRGRLPACRPDAR